MPILYHYCSSETFVSIVRNRSIRLSSLMLSNDSQEGSVILDVLLQLAKEADLSFQKLSLLETELRFAYDFFDGLGFCLSENGDLLSQWRGYADDGRGVCIGFNSEYLEKLGTQRHSREERSFGLKKLVYDRDGQKEIASESFQQMKQLLETGAFKPMQGSVLFPTNDEQKESIKKATDQARFVILGIMLRMFDIKNPAFTEEQEWRLVSFTSKSVEDSVIAFRACGDKVVPYFEVKLEELGLESIEQVVLGPKHQSPLPIIQQMLKSSGFKSVKLSKSSATYR